MVSTIQIAVSFSRQICMSKYHLCLRAVLLTQNGAKIWLVNTVQNHCQLCSIDD